MKNLATIGKEIYEFNNQELELMGLLLDDEKINKPFLIVKSSGKYISYKFSSEAENLERQRLIKSSSYQTEDGKRWRLRLTKLGHLIIKQLQS